MAARRACWLTTLVMLEADARRANGERDAAASLTSQVISHAILDGDFEVWALLRGVAAREAALGAAGASRR